MCYLKACVIIAVVCLYFDRMMCNLCVHNKKKFKMRAMDMRFCVYIFILSHEKCILCGKSTHDVQEYSHDTSE